MDLIQVQLKIELQKRYSYIARSWETEVPASFLFRYGLDALHEARMVPIVRSSTIGQDEFRDINHQNELVMMIGSWASLTVVKPHNVIPTLTTSDDRHISHPILGSIDQR